MTVILSFPFPQLYTIICTPEKILPCNQAVVMTTTTICVIASWGGLIAVLVHKQRCEGRFKWKERILLTVAKPRASKTWDIRVYNTNYTLHRKNCTVQIRRYKRCEGERKLNIIL
jgi:hypothetical protein